jgi:alpha-L-rhamnosidase
VLVAGDTRSLRIGQADLWDSGRVTSTETLNIVYAGRPLASGQECFWKVRVWDKDGKESGWSKSAWWSMGLLSPKDWKAEWISFRDSTPVPVDREQLQLPPPRHYRKEFGVSKPVRRAMLYGSALGIAEFLLNGQRVGDAYFEPGWSDYRQRAYYRTHDVTALVRRGANCVGAIVAEGWYSGYVGYGLLVGYGPNRTGRNFYGKTPALLAQLEIEYADGSRATIVSDPSWRVTDTGPFQEADLIMGESYDARAAMPGWDRAGFDPAGWDTAIRAEDNGSVIARFFESGVEREVELGFQRPPILQAYAAPAIRVTQELPTRRITEPRPGVYIFDLGQNFAGIVRLRVKAPAGTRIQLRYGEMLHPDGRLMTENLRRARATDFYTCRGGGTETWQPQFTYHGFQYVEVTGLPSAPSADAITGLALHNDTPLVGEFACSDPVLTQFARNALWTQRANFLEIPTDCPQRDERLGWMGDAQVYARTATCFADVAAFFTKWVDDIREAQRDFGAYPDYCPYPMAHGQPGATHGTAWTDAGIVVPHTVWQVYGDTRILERHWDSMVKFMDWRRRTDPEFKGVNLGNPWGDWLNVNENTPIEYIDLCYHALSARLLAEMADALGRAAEANRYRLTFDAARASFQRLYLRPDATVAVDTQTAYVLALWVGLIPAELANQSADALAAKLAKNDFRMATGFLGTKPLLAVLTRQGHHDLAVRLFQSRRFPSWGYEVEQGATSVWERWDSFTREHGFDGATGGNNAAMNSFSHYSFGAVMEWAFRDLAGIDTQGTGFRRLVLRPGPPVTTHPEADPLDWVTATYEHPRGRIASAWRVRDRKFQWQVTIPANTTAEAHIPAKDAGAITERGHPLASRNGIKVLRTVGDRVVLELESGSYRFEAVRGSAPSSYPKPQP